MTDRTVTRRCAWCGVPVRLSGPRGRAQARRGRAYCSEAHTHAWVRRQASRRMRLRNPMAHAAVRAKMRATLIARGHRPPTRGGNGSGLTQPQAALLARLPAGWSAEVVVTTGRRRRQRGHPSHYKLDVACLAQRVAVEIDGGSHRSTAVARADRRKVAFLRAIGWRVIRFANAEILQDPERCARVVLALAGAQSA